MLELSDGKTIDLKKSDMFWEGILKVDNILENKGININKGTISFKDCINLLSNENIDFEKATAILNKILNYSVRGYLSEYYDLS